MFVGRQYEQKIITDAINSDRAELIILYGRRRVGKSALLQRVVRKKGDLYFEALQDVPQKKQIEHFLRQLALQTRSPQSVARSWSEAFEVLTYHLERGRHYVVFDEFAWMASKRSELVSLLKFFWDNRWKKNPKITLVLCGSITGFMLRHIVHSRALHNRKTLEIKLPVLPAWEAKRFFKAKRSDLEIAKFLMVFGGIPKYLEQIDVGVSLEENLDRLCFRKHGFFLTEFDTVFKEQFKVVRNYERIVRVLAQRSCSKEDLAGRLGIATGGGLSGYLQALEQADFIKTQSPATTMGKGQKTRKLVLWDEWLRFYFTWVEPHRDVIEMNTRPGLMDRLTGVNLDAYFGSCFEQLCARNLQRIYDNLGLDFHRVVGFGPFFRQRRRDENGDQGIQIDLMVKSKGNVLTLMECKFSSRPIGVSVIKDFERKIAFLHAPRKFAIERVLICAGDVTTDLRRSDYFHRIVGLADILS
jgi:hypothetical protein